VRRAFFKCLADLAENDDRIFLVVGDLGFGQIEAFRQRFPRQFINAGVAEQNMTGFASGLAMSGKIVFTYSIGNFPTLRCLEQIRNDVCYHKTSVNIVSVGAGYAYGSLGMSHHATEDLSIMRSIPNIKVVAPGDSWETEMAIRAMVRQPGPHYIRLSKAPDFDIDSVDKEFSLGKTRKIVDGNDVCLVSTGSMLETTMRVAMQLSKMSINAKVLSMHTVQPVDVESLKHELLASNVVFSIEEHSIRGGLGSTLAEIISELDSPGIVLKRLGLPENYSSVGGTREYLLEMSNFTENDIFIKIREFLTGRNVR
jgi:transketolase